MSRLLRKKRDKITKQYISFPCLTVKHLGICIVYLLAEHIHFFALGFNAFKLTPFMQVDKDYSAYQQSDYRIADGDVFSQGYNAFIVLFHKLFLSNYSPSKNGGLLVPHTASPRCEAGVFLSMLILLPSTYNSRPAWEFNEQERYHPLPAL